jgi:diphthine-ammonia ligase
LGRRESRFEAGSQKTLLFTLIGERILSVLALSHARGMRCRGFFSTGLWLSLPGKARAFLLEQFNDMRAICSWSGGKDSCMALYSATQDGCQVGRLLTFVSKKYKRCCFHGIEPKLLSLQAASIGIPIARKEVGDSMETYERDFKKAVSDLMRHGFEGMVFGDIYLDEHKNWVDRVCGELNIKPIEPLWGKNPGKAAREFVAAGFKTVIVSCQADLFDETFVGRIMDEKMINELESRGICPCGENGEFHTFVVDGPIFSRRIDILDSRPLLRNGFWKHWFLDIRKYGVGEMRG